MTKQQRDELRKQVQLRVKHGFKSAEVTKETLIALLDLADEADRLREAMERYGRHDDASVCAVACICPAANPIDPGECTCGLTKALARPATGEAESG